MFGNDFRVCNEFPYLTQKLAVRGKSMLKNQSTYLVDVV